MTDLVVSKMVDLVGVGVIKMLDKWIPTGLRSSVLRDATCISLSRGPASGRCSLGKGDVGWKSP